MHVDGQSFTRKFVRADQFLCQNRSGGPLFTADHFFRDRACGDNEITMHEIESKSFMTGWEAIRISMLAVVTESQGMPAGQKCVLCGENYALTKCWQCGPQSYFCQSCMDSVHSRIAFFTCY